MDIREVFKNGLGKDEQLVMLAFYHLKRDIDTVVWSTGLSMPTVKAVLRRLGESKLPDGLKAMLPDSKATVKSMPQVGCDQALRVWEYYNTKWCEFGGRGLKYTPQKASKIKARLKTFTEDDLREAIDNLFNDPFMRGDNPNGRVYLGPEQVFGSDDKVTKRLAFSVKPNVKAPANTEEPGYYYFNG